MAMRFDRSFYIGKGYELAHKDDDRGIEIWAGLTAGVPYAIAFQGKRQKPDWHHRFRSVDNMTAHIKRWLDGIKERDTRMAQYKSERLAKGRGVEVGDVLRASWGYDQTNIDYYEVTALIGSKMVEVRKISEKSIDTAWMQGDSVPLVGSYIGEPMRRFAKDGFVKIDEVRRAYKMQPAAEVAGVKVYSKSHWTAYA